MRLSLRLSFFIAIIILLFNGSNCFAESQNPPPCNEEYHCSTPVNPRAYGTGPTSICKNEEGTWNIQSHRLGGLKKKCNEPEVDDGSVPHFRWSYSVSNGGPTGVGESFTWTPTRSGNYTITWTSPYAQGNPCDLPAVTRSYDFTVPPIDFILSGGGQVDLCDGETLSSSFTLTATSQCVSDFIIVNWTIVKVGGAADVTITPNSGAESVTSGQEVEVPFTASAPANGAAGNAIFTLTATDAITGEQQTATITVNVFKLIDVTVNNRDYAPFQGGESVHVTVNAEGQLGNRKLHYELINTDSGIVKDQKDSTSLTETFHIVEPGRYIVRVTACNDQRTKESTKFVLWTLMATPGDIEFVWDDYKGKLDDIFAPVQTEANNWTKRIGNLDKANAKLGKDAKKGHDEFEAVKRALRAHRQGLHTSLIAGEADLQNLRIELMATNRTAAITRSAIIAAQAQGDLVLAAQLAAQLEQLVARAAALSQSIAIVTTHLGEIRSSIAVVTDFIVKSETVAQGFEGLLVWAESADRVLAFAGLAVDIYQLKLLADETAEFKTQLEEAKAEAPKFKELTDEILQHGLHRLAEPLVGAVHIDTIPGDLKVTFAEIPSFITKDPKFNEKTWNYEHFTLINNVLGWVGEPGVIDAHTTAGIEGHSAFTVFAYGNLGSGEIYAYCQDQPAGLITTVTSTGSTQEELKAALAAQLLSAKEAEERVHTGLEALELAIGVTGSLLAAIGILAGEALIASIGATIVLIAGAIAVVVAVIFYLYHAFFPNPLLKSIVELFPKASP